MRAHIVQQGEHLLGLAARMGFDADTVWNDDANRELREQRPDPQVLAPGDVLYVPEPESPARLSIEPRTENRYTAQVERLEVALRLAEDADHPVAGEPFAVEGLTCTVEGTTDADGVLRFSVPAHTRQVVLVLPDREDRRVLRLGHLEPADTARGARQRLVGLGHLVDERAFDATAPETRPGEDRAGLAEALAAFQRARGLEETGQLDPETTQALRDEHA